MISTNEHALPTHVHILLLKISYVSINFANKLYREFKFLFIFVEKYSMRKKEKENSFIAQKMENLESIGVEEGEREGGKRWGRKG